jgi:hypothetical protein
MFHRFTSGSFRHEKERSSDLPSPLDTILFREKVRDITILNFLFTRICDWRIAKRHRFMGVR